jgi:hypothetical protein
MENYPDVVQDLIVQFLDIKDVVNLMCTSSHFNNFCSHQYVWYTRIQNAYSQFKEFKSKFSDQDWKNTYRHYSRQCNGEYYNVGIQVNGEMYFSRYILDECAEASVGKVLIGGSLTAKGIYLMGLKIADRIIYVQYSPWMYDYYPIVVAKITETTSANIVIESPWIDEGRYGFTYSYPSIEMDGLYSQNEYLKKKLEKFVELTKFPCPFQNGLYSFERDGKWYDLKCEFSFNTYCGWIMRGESAQNVVNLDIVSDMRNGRSSDSKSVSLFGVVSENYICVVIHWPKMLRSDVVNEVDASLDDQHAGSEREFGIYFVNETNTYPGVRFTQFVQWKHFDPKDPVCKDSKMIAKPK